MPFMGYRWLEASYMACRHTKLGKEQIALLSLRGRARRAVLRVCQQLASIVQNGTEKLMV